MNYSLIFACLIISFSGISQKSTESAPKYVVTKNDAENINLYFEAIKAKSLNDYEKATVLIEKYLEKDQTNGAAYYEAAQLYLAADNEIRTRVYIEKALELDPNNQWYNGFYIEFLNKIQDYETALKVIEKKLKTKDNDYTKMQYTYLLQKAGNTKKALKVLEEMEHSNADNETILMQKFQLYYKMKDIPNAENELKKIIQLDPSNVQSLSNLAELEIEVKKPNEATKIFKNILLLEPNNPAALMHMVGNALKEKDTASYQFYSHKIIQNKSVNIDTKIKFLSFGLMNFSKLDSTTKKLYVSMAEELPKFHPQDPKSYSILGDFYYLNGTNDKALENYKKTLQLKSDNYDVWQNLFSTQYALKKYKELADSTTSALEYFPAHALVYYYNALANNQLNNYSQSEKSLKKALRFIGTDQAMETQILSTLAETYHKMKNFEASDKSFEDALKIEPSNVYNLNNYAYYLSERKNKLEEAKKMSRKSLEITPDNANFLDTYAWICFQMENYEEAKSYQEKALEIEKEDKSTIFEHYGDILYKLNDVEKALVYWQKALQSGNNAKALPLKIKEKKYLSPIE